MTSTEFDFPRGKSVNELNSSGKTFVKQRKQQSLKIYKTDEDLFKVHKRNFDQIDTEINESKNKKLKRKNKRNTRENEDEQKVIIESMSWSSIPENIVIYGCIQEITDYEIKLSTVGGIVVKVGITNISDAYTQLLEKFAINADSMADTEVLKPSGMFEIGQYFPLKIIHKSVCDTYVYMEINGSLNPSDIYSDIIPSYFLKIPNMVIVAAVESIEDHGYVMNVGLNGMKAFLSKEKAQSAIQSLKARKSFKSLAIGQLVYCVIETVNQRTITLTTRPKLLSNFKFTSQMNISLSCMIPGIKVCATVMNVNEKGVELNILDEFAGFATRSHLKTEWDLPKNSYSIGDKVEGTVLYVNPITKQIALTLKSNLNPKEVRNYWKNVKIGSIFENASVVGRDQMGSIVFRLSNNIKAIAKRKHLFDQQFNEMEDFDFDTKFSIGSTHKCRVYSINFMDRSVNITLKESLLNIPSVFVDDLKIGSFVTGIVKSINKNGIRVRIGFALYGFIPNIHLADAPNVLIREKLFPIDKEVKCRVIKLDRTTSPNKICLTRKKSLLNKGLTILDKYETIVQNTKTEGVVVLIQNKGLLIEFFNNVKAWIPIRFLSTYHIEYPEKVFRIGQIVSCSVVNVNVERERMTCSLIDYKEESKNKVISEEPKAANISNKISNNLVHNIKNKTDKTDKKNKKDKKDKKKSSKKLKTIEALINKDKPQEKTINKEIDDKPQVKTINKEIDDKQQSTSTPNQTRINKYENFRRNVLCINEEFKWDIDNATPNLNDINSFAHNYDSSSDNFSDDSNIVSADKNATKKKKSRKERNEEVRQREELLRKKEEMMIDKDRKPETVDDFEIASPNSSLVWLKFMAFYLEDAEIHKARAVGERALKVISFREEQEKQNVWVALLNLENLYGTVSSLDQLFKRALQYNEPITIYKHLANIYEQSNKLESAEALYDTMLKKFKKNKEVWINFGLFYIKNNRKESARKLMQRSLTCLDKWDHIDIISKFAQMEFQYGDIEHGKTLFENIFANFSKRTDLWAIYIDMLIKFTLSAEKMVEAVDFIRNIFEKVITLKFSARKMKFFFKRYIDFENQFGDEERITRIKQKALEYVETRIID